MYSIIEYKETYTMIHRPQYIHTHTYIYIYICSTSTSKSLHSSIYLYTCIPFREYILFFIFSNRVEKNKNSIQKTHFRWQRFQKLPVKIYILHIYMYTLCIYMNTPAEAGANALETKSFFFPPLYLYICMYIFIYMSVYPGRGRAGANSLSAKSFLAPT